MYGVVVVYSRHVFGDAKIPSIVKLYFIVSKLKTAIAFKIRFKGKKQEKKNSLFPIQYINGASSLELYILISSVDYFLLFSIPVMCRMHKRIGTVSKVLNQLEIVSRTLRIHRIVRGVLQSFP